MASRVVPVVGGAALGAVLAGQVLGRRSGSTAAERARALAGDDLVESPSLVTNHAITIEEPAARVWPWLTQVGWHRGGWYTPRWVERLLFPGNWPSADRLEPALVRDLRAGDSVPDGPPGTAWFVVERADPPRTLVLHSRTHLPPGWRDRYGAALDWVWTFDLREDSGHTRLLVRNRGWVHPWWVNAGYLALFVPADHVMATGMLRGLKRRVEAAT